MHDIYVPEYGRQLRYDSTCVALDMHGYPCLPCMDVATGRTTSTRGVRTTARGSTRRPSRSLEWTIVRPSRSKGW
eukprot:46528-Eustigmatos_ZCMA.PRE.1